jgi:cation:H+ antiporter
MIKMALWIPVIGFIFGIAILIKASDKAVDLALRFSHITGMMKLSVGMMLVGAMTSLPEFSIAMTSSFSGASSIMFGNLIGGSFTDLFFVLGIGAAIYGLKVSKRDLEKGVEIFLISSALLVYGMLFGFNQIFGFISVIVFILFSERLLSGKKTNNKNWIDLRGGFLVLIKITALVAVIIFAAEIVTLSTKIISAELGITETLIGATIIALSTTTPELFVTLAAGKRNEYDLMVGNVIGSCFINIVLIMGLSAIISPIAVGVTEMIILAALFGAYFTFYLFAAGKQIDRFQGILMLAMYCLYVIVMLAVA